MENTKVGPFQIGRRLGNNRRQKVYKAKQLDQNIDVALKFIGIPEQSQRKQAIEKIKIEFDLLKKLSHPNLVRILGAGVADDQIFVATEFMKAESLTALLARRGKFAFDQVIEYGRQVASLLDYLHDQNIIHSKLTPDKILINKSGSVKVTDVRLNRSKKRRWDASRKRELDIAAYMAPEQFQEGATEKSDIYSLGVILYEMLTGKLPYEPETLGRMARRKMTENATSVSSSVMYCPVWLDKIVCQMIDPDPRRRPHTAKAVILAMNELRELETTQKSSVSQISGSFNPLTAGFDKTEANRLLGKKDNQASSTPFFQSTGFLIGSLVLIVSVIAVALIPASSESNYSDAKQLMASQDSSDWRRARDYLKKIMAKGPGDPLYGQAENMYYLSRQKTLELQAQRGRIVGLQSPESKEFILAYRAEKENKLDEAIEGYEKLLNKLNEQGDERHIYSLANQRLQKMVDQINAPDLNEDIKSWLAELPVTLVPDSHFYNKLNKRFQELLDDKTFNLNSFLTVADESSDATLVPE
ncbi:MAG: serine/threonine-protein kinase [Planctomycetota bacterium]